MMADFSWSYKELGEWNVYLMFDRTGVAGAVLQTALLLSQSLRDHLPNFDVEHFLTYR